MMKHDTHTQWIMKDTESFYVRICQCGVIHLCFGAATINLTSEALIAVSETLREVATTLRQQMNASVPANVITGKFNLIAQD
jgi:hypothetical protein